MAKKIIRSSPGFFGTTIHRDSRGHVVGRSVPGLFGTTIHKDAKGKIIGKSSPGFWVRRFTETKTGRW